MERSGALRWRHLWVLPSVLIAGLLSASAPEATEAAVEAAGSALPALPRNSLAVYVGVYTTSFWLRSFSINEVGYEPNFVVALITTRDFITTGWGLRIGHESGIAIRFGQDFSIETWRGMTVSFSARLIGGSIVTPRLVLGLSSVSNPIGVEVEREAAVEDGDMLRLVYLGSELARSLEALPFLEVFYRLHHRSGAARFWGNLPDGHNANGVGIRLWY